MNIWKGVFPIPGVIFISVIACHEPRPYRGVAISNTIRFFTQTLLPYEIATSLRSSR